MDTLMTFMALFLTNSPLFELFEEEIEVTISGYF